MKAFYCDHFVLPLPDGHRFPMSKYELLRQRVAEESDIELLVPDAATDEELSLCHTPDYVNRVTSGQMSKDEIRELGFPWSPEMVERSRRSVGATISAARVALEEGAAANLAGGTHHAMSDRAQGFCVFNDCAVAAKLMQKEDIADQILIVDADVHQGNGTAEICSNDKSIYTFSIHGGKNFPARKALSDLDIEIEDATEDEVYLDCFDQGLATALNESYPDLVFYLAGADPYENDKLGRLSLSKEGLAKRDQMVMDYCSRRSLPLVMVMAGGYAAEVNDIVDIHFASLEILADYAHAIQVEAEATSLQ
ncbi:MAG: histone deacetylase [Porticoccaceae bacterium]|jgi:acetoin utilization deacetylase AcuC-like enzyme|nr:histone deacetylase [Porticoccaceae bacterium]